MTATMTHERVRHDEGSREGPVRIACAAAAVAAVVPVAFASLPGGTGAEVTTAVTGSATALQVAAILAVFAAAGLLLAAVRLGERLGGTAGRVALAAGAAVAVLLAAYYTTFGATAVVADLLLTEPGAGVGESGLVVLNMVEMTRYAPGLALTAAAVACRRSLPRPVWIVAAVLLVATLVPFTAWLAAIAIPAWLGLSAAAVRVPRGGTVAA